MARLYDRAVWERARRQALHDANHRCTYPGCGKSLVGLGQGAHVHHKKPLDRAPALGLEPLNLAPLCREHHTATHVNERTAERRAETLSACDLDGNPTHPAHPWNAAAD